MSVENTFLRVFARCSPGATSFGGLPYRTICNITSSMLRNASLKTLFSRYCYPPHNNTCTTNFTLQRELMIARDSASYLKVSSVCLCVWNTKIILAFRNNCGIVRRIKSHWTTRCPRMRCRSQCKNFAIFLVSTGTLLRFLTGNPNKSTDLTRRHS